MAKEKFSWAGFWNGFKTIFTRNSILIIILYIISKYSNYMKNGFRTFAVVGGAGLSKTVFGTLLSFFLIVALIFEAPSGSLCDNLRSKLKYILSGCFALRLVCWAGFILMKDAPFAYALFAFDGILYAFMETAVPAILAMSVDKRAMGSAYAVMMGLTKIITASGKATGIAIYNNSGVAAAALAAGALSLVGAVIAIALDNKKLVATQNTVLGDSGTPQLQSIVKKKPSLKDGICWKMLPLCLIANMAIVTFNGADNFFPLYAESLQINYLGAITLGNTLQGILDIFIGVLCDVFNPAIVVIVGLAGQAIAPFLWASGAGAAVLNAGTVIFYCTRVYGTAIRITGMKAISHREQGAFQATFMGCFNLFSIFSATLIGWCIDRFSYTAVWSGLGVWQILALAAYIVLEFTFLRKLRSKDAELA